MTSISSTTLDQKTDEFLAGFGQLWTSIANLSIPEKRAELHRLFTIPKSEMEPVGSTRDETITGPNGDIVLRIFIPEGEGPFPVMVYFHHGGWVLGSLDECEPTCRHLTNETGVVVVAVDYRLAPEHKYPAPLHDAYAATQWVIKNVHKIQGDPNRVGVGGESAGGNLAAAVALMARENKDIFLAYQALFYPILTCDLDPNTYENNPDEHLLTWQNMQWFCEQYLVSLEQKEESLASPVKAKNFADLPPALILTAEWDPLRIEGHDYAKSLESGGVEVQHHCFSKVIHGFLGFPIYPSEVVEAMAKIKRFVSKNRLQK